MKSKEKIKEYNKNATKEEQLKRIWKIEEKNAIVLEGNSQRVNISIHAGLWNEIPNTINKSKLMQNLLKAFLEKDKKCEIILRRAEI